MWCPVRMAAEIETGSLLRFNGHTPIGGLSTGFISFSDDREIREYEPNTIALLLKKESPSVNGTCVLYVLLPDGWVGHDPFWAIELEIWCDDD